MKNKTLVKNVLENGQRIKLETKGGLYIVCEIVDDNTYKKIEDYLETKLKENKKRVKELNKTIKNMNQKKYFESLIDQKIRHNKNLSREQAEKLAIKDKERTIKYKERLIERINNYKPLSERKVIDEYGNIMGDGRIIIIEGKEQGKYFGSWEVEDDKND